MAEDSEAAYERSSVARNTAHLMSSQLTTWVLGLILTVVQPRLLGAEAVGELRIAYSLWYIVAVLVSAGTTTYLTLEIVRDRARGLAHVGPIIMIRVVGTLAGLPLVIGYGLLTGASGRLLTLMAIVSVALFGIGMGDLARSVFLGLERMARPALADIVSRFCQVAVVLTVLLLGGDVRAVAVISAAAMLFRALLMFQALWHYPGVTWWGAPSDAIRLVRASLPYLVAEAVVIVYLQIDTIVISHLTDGDRVGWYATADQLFSSLLFVPTILMTSLFPVLGRLHNEQPSELIGVIRRGVRLLLIVVVPIGAGAAVVSTNVSVLLFGEAFRNTGQVLFVYGIVLIPMSGSIVFGRYAVATGRQGFWNRLMIAAIVLSVPLDIVLVPWAEHEYGNGAIGGALAYVFTESLMVAIGIWKLLPDLFDRALAVRSIKVSLTCAAMVAVTWPVRNRFVVIPMVVGVVVYSLATFALSVFDDDERATLRSAVARVRRRAPAVATGGSGIPIDEESDD